MNTMVRTHAQNIVDTARNGRNFFLDGLPFESSGINATHHFKLSNNKEETASYICAVKNSSMAVDILEVAHKQLGSNFDKKYFEDFFESQEIDHDLGIYLVYVKQPVVNI